MHLTLISLRDLPSCENLRDNVGRISGLECYSLEKVVLAKVTDSKTSLDGRIFLFRGNFHLVLKVANLRTQSTAISCNRAGK